MTRAPPNQVDQFCSSLAEAAEGVPGLLLVEGPVGTGKSRLLPGG